MTDQKKKEGRRCLLIAPLSFYSFHHTLTEALERRGFLVEVLNEEFPANTFGKVLGKIALPLLRRLTFRGLKSRLANCATFDLVLIIKGRGIGPDAVRFLRTKAKRIVGYNFDSFLFNPSPLDWHHLTDRYATFDIDDAKSLGLPLVHLFSAVTQPPQLERPYELSIVQRVHSHRLAYADLLLRALPAGSRPFVFFFEGSILTLVLGFIRNPYLYTRLFRHISLKPLSYSDAISALGASRVTFDYAHPKQSGITARCFEAQSLGVSILSNNRAAVDSGLFAPGSISCLPASSDQNKIGELLAELGRRRPLPQSRTIEDFLFELLADAAASKPSANLGKSS
jgi:hypothetical protein